MKGQIDVGELREPAVLELPATTQDAYGEITPGTYTKVRDIIGAIRILRGTERFEQGMVAANIDARFMCRHVPGVTNRMVLKVRSQRYRIHAIINHDVRDQWMELYLSLDVKS